MQSKIVAEREEAMIAKRVLERLDGNAVTVSRPSQSLVERSVFDKLHALSAASRPPTLVEYILKALQDSFMVWSNANDIEDFVSKLKGAEIPMSSISPMVTELKKRGVIVRDGLNVALASRVRRRSLQRRTDGGLIKFPRRGRVA